VDVGVCVVCLVMLCFEFDVWIVVRWLFGGGWCFVVGVWLWCVGFLVGIMSVGVV
jgi:hypothetical protein